MIGFLGLMNMKGQVVEVREKNKAQVMPALYFAFRRIIRKILSYANSS